MVDFSKLRLPNAGGGAGEGTEPKLDDEATESVGASEGSDSSTLSPTNGGSDGDTKTGSAASVSGGFRLRLPSATNVSTEVDGASVVTPTASQGDFEVDGDDSEASSSEGNQSIHGDSPTSEAVDNAAVGDLSELKTDAVDENQSKVTPKIGLSGVFGGPSGDVSEAASDSESVIVAPDSKVTSLSGPNASPMEDSFEGSDAEVQDQVTDVEDPFSDFPEDDWESSEEVFDDEDSEDGGLIIPGRVASNPLLEDDDDDEMVSGVSLSQSLGRANGLKELTEDTISTEESETFTGFDDQFKSLLEDDDEAWSPTEPSVEPGDVSSSSAPSPVSTPAKGTAATSKASEVKSDSPEWSSVEVPYKAPKSTDELEVDARERQVLLRKKKAQEVKEKEFSSDFIGDPTRVVRVNDEGETRSEQGKVRSRVTKPVVGGKLKAQELDFFKNLGSVRSEFSDGLLTTDLVIGPMGKRETDMEKKARVEHLERVLDSRNLFRAGKTFKLDNKTVDTLCFLALFRYATHSHIARMFGEKPLTTVRRLRKMRDAGLVASKKLYSQHAIWFLTEPGVIVSGYDVKHITEAKLTPSMFPHQFTVNHVAANLMGGQLNVLNLPDFPTANRLNIKGHKIMGEQLTSELEILSSFAKIKLFEQSSTFRPKLLAMRDGEFQRWTDTPNNQSVPTPEMVFGNEWMFTLFPPLAVGVAYHVPDLVVKRQRASDGTPRSIAVEVEINNKPLASYEKTLRAYADDKLIFGQVIWVCKTVGPAKKLEKVGRDLGIIQSGKLKIVPIWTNDGVFKGRDLWTI